MATQNCPPCLAWEVLNVTSGSSFLVRRGGRSAARTEFSIESGNLSNKNSFAANGLVNDKTVDIAFGEKGAVVTMKRTGRVAARKTEASKTHTFKLTKDSRRSNGAIRNAVAGYRPDLMQAALARYSQVKLAQNPKRGVQKKRSNRRRR
jgi:large subunit ribosomal protein L28e